MEHFQNGKQIRELLDMPERPQAPKHIFWASKSLKSSNKQEKLPHAQQILPGSFCLIRYKGHVKYIIQAGAELRQAQFKLRLAMPATLPESWHLC